MFDADEAAEALEKPKLKHEGVTYTGRVASLPEALRFIGRMQRLERGEAVDVEELIEHMDEALAELEFTDPDGESLDTDAFLERVPASVAKDALLDFLGRALESKRNGSA